MAVIRWPGSRGSADRLPGTAPRRLGVHLLVVLMALLVPALLAGGGTAWELGRAYRQSAEAGLRGAVRAMAAAADRELDVAATAASSIAGSRAVRALAFNGGAADDIRPLADLYARARAVGEAFGGWVVLARADGRQVFNTLRPLGTDLPVSGGMPWIERALASKTPVFSDLFFGSVSQRLVLGAFAPVLPLPGDTAEGTAAEPRFVVILAYDPARLATLLVGVRDGEVAGLIAVADGRIVARSVGHARAVGQTAPDWIAGPVRTGESGSASGASLEAVAINAAFQRMDRVPWGVVVTSPLATEAAAWRGPLQHLAIGSLALLAAGFALAAWLAERLLRPLNALAREAEAVAAGIPAPPAARHVPVAEFEALRLALRRANESIRARADAEGRAAAAEESAAALRAERDRARLYFDVAGAMLIVLGPDGTVRGTNRRGLEVLGLAREEELVGRDWFDAFTPERLRVGMREVFDAVAVGRAEAPAPYEAPVLRADGAERLVAWRNAVLRGGSGELVAVVSSGEDITESRAAEQRQRLLTREVDHRAKNALAVVQSIVRLTRAERLEDFAAAVEGRIDAMARAHTLLARERWAGGDLAEMVEAELAPYDEAARVAASGPAARLAPEAVQAVSMVLHELATNAAKYGALSVPGGRVQVAWAASPGSGLDLSWTEEGGPALPPGPPKRRGFGSRMIDATMAGQLGGTVRFDWRTAGLRCDLRIPPERLVSVGNNGKAPSEGALREGGRGRPRRTLEGCRVLVAEDESLVAIDIKDELVAAGCHVVGLASNVTDTLRLAEASKGRLDAAVLDVNLGGQAVFPVADVLVRGGVPVVFATAYGDLARGWEAGGGQGRTALVRKPLARGTLGEALRRLLPDEAEPPRDAAPVATRNGRPARFGR
jgi:PAS domain S-box-containing protein